MNDKELLEFAAKAMECEVVAGWNPLDDDGDCARLEAALNICINWVASGVIAWCNSKGVQVSEFYRDHDDKNAARRYATTKTAARIGEDL